MKAREGFTLVELIVVIFIISIITAMIMPNLWDREERALQSEAKRIGSTLRYINDEAAGKKQTYLVKIDLNTDSWSYAGDKESRTFKMKKDIIFKDIIVPSLGEVSIGEVNLTFGPTGPEEPITVHLVKNKSEYTVMFNHISGRAKIHEGYVQ